MTELETNRLARIEVLKLAQAIRSTNFHTSSGSMMSGAQTYRTYSAADVIADAEALMEFVSKP